MKTCFSLLLATFVLFGANSTLAAEWVVKPVEWNIGDTRFAGQLVYDGATTQVRPGLLMVPNWHGVNAAALAKAKQIAGDDYVVLLADMYGKSVRPGNNEEARAAVTPLYADRGLMRERIGKAYAVLRAAADTAPIDLDRLAAIGFCFGGSAVLDLARSGATIDAVVAFHGGLKTDDPALARQIKASVLVMNGADDQGTMPDAEAFMDEMRATDADWQFVVLGNAVHCFTEVGDDAPGCRYDPRAARRSYAMMEAWLADAFAN